MLNHKFMLDEQTMDEDPVTQFSRWFDEAIRMGAPEANAMGLSTVSAEGHPVSRIVLLKKADTQGFVWFTNYNSRKGKELQHNPFAALLFYWPTLVRQVRIEGKVERLNSQENEVYFQSRPLPSRISAYASYQSQTIDSRTTLEEHYQKATQRYGENPCCPAFWGGYRCQHHRVEFWQGRAARLHDRIIYIKEKEGNIWRKLRLQP